MDTIFDIGMYDGADTTYYLETGHKVVAVEANPTLCTIVAKRLQRYIDSGQLIIENVAISNQPGTIDLHICGQDLGSSSIVKDRLTDRFPLGTYTVPTMTYVDLVRKHGKPKYLKIDIEGADKECVLSVTSGNAPQYLSFEAHNDMEEMINHAYAGGYRRFKVIHQNSFRSIQNQDSFMDRVRYKVVRLAGFDRPLFVKRDGRLFVLGHSAGPAPWKSDGPFYSQDAILKAWKATAHRGWYDVHAALA
jgi:FkbM family methyltransferase